jgi:ArsR family transcriptional regulator, virulence genes transcriptional regulator
MTLHDIYSAFGNRVRMKIILCLARKQKNVSQLIQSCALSQSAVSQHLLKLKKSGIVEAKKDGKEVWYSLKYKKAADISRLLQKLEQEVL